MRRTRLRTLLLALTLALPFTGCGGGDATAPRAAATVEATTFAPSLGIDLSAAGWTKNAAGLYTRTLSSPAGAAPTAANGQRVTVRYTGWLANGTQFESSTYAFALGRGEVIAGWDQGIAGMRVGERRRLLIPPALGYGARGSGPIPGNAVLVFDVELLAAE
jgi:peptidylprolyl isomerase